MTVMRFDQYRTFERGNLSTKGTWLSSPMNVSCPLEEMNYLIMIDIEAVCSAIKNPMPLKDLCGEWGTKCLNTFTLTPALYA